MSKVINYIKESYDELVNRVTWPSWAELQSSSIVVMIAAIIIAVLVYGMDAGTNFIVNFLYGVA